MGKAAVMGRTGWIVTKRTLYGIWPFLIWMAKFMRYGIFRQNLVDMGIGHAFLSAMKNEHVKFSFLNMDHNISADVSGNLVYIYQKLNFLRLDSYIAFEIFITVIGNLLLFFMIRNRKKQLDCFTFILLSVMILAVNIYAFCLSKEPLQLLFFIFMSYIIRKYAEHSFTCIFLLVLLIMLYSFLFRTYYMLMIPFAGLSLLLYQFYAKNQKKFLLILLFLTGAGILYATCLSAAGLVDKRIYEELIRVRIRMVPSNTRLVPLFSSNNLLTQTMNYVSALVRLLFPLELIRLGFKYLIYVFVQLVITYFILHSFCKIKELGKEAQYSLTIVLAFILMSAVHEIEYGSWIRHESVLLPVLLQIDSKKNCWQALIIG